MACLSEQRGISLVERLITLTDRTGYLCIQRNGQRYFGPAPNWVGAPPGKGTELFLDRLPRDCFEDELVPILETIAPIYQLRMMMNFTGLTRGFAFVKYRSVSDAKRALIALNNYQIRPGCKMGVVKSIDNCRLYFGNVPTNKEPLAALNDLRNIVSDVRKVIMIADPKTKRCNRGFFFADFTDHRSAAMARRYLSSSGIEIWESYDTIIDWADPEPEIDSDVMDSVTKLFLRNMPDEMNAEIIKRILAEVMPRNSIERVYMGSHFAFIHFDYRNNAERGKMHLENYRCSGKRMDVQWARPSCFKKHATAISPNYRSVPPRFRRMNRVQDTHENNVHVFKLH